MKARILVRDWELEEVPAGSRAQLKVLPYPYRTYAGSVAQVLREGMTGTAKVAGRSRPLAWQAGRGAWRWLRSQVW